MVRRGMDFRVNSSVNTSGIQRASRAFALQARAMKKVATASSILNTNMARIARLQRIVNRETATEASINNRAARASSRRTRVIRNQERAQRRLNTTNRAGLNIMQRLAAAMVIFGASHQVIRGFRALVSAGVDFNKTMESAQLGVAALISAAGKVVDSQGRMVNIAEKFAFAQGEARRQVQLLRKDALATEATFQELMNVFQLGIAPGLTAGMNLDDIRKFAVRISQAATALQMPQRQLAEEIRSILRGTIRLQSTRIAAALNITNQQIRKWRDMGVLGKELFKRFEAFGEASKKLRETWIGLAGRVKDAFQQLAGTAGQEFFETLKKGLKDAFNLMVNINEEGIELNPELVATVRLFFDALRDIVLYAREAVSLLTMSGVQGTMVRLSSLMREVGKVVIDIALGIKDGLETLSDMASRAREWGDSLGLIDVRFGDVLRRLVEISTIWAGVSVSMKLMKASMLGLAAAANTFKIAMVGVKGAATLIFSKFGLMVAAVTAIATIVNDIISRELGVSANFVTQMTIGFRIMGLLASKVVRTLKSGFEIAFQLVKVGLANLSLGYMKLYKGYLLVKSTIAPDAASKQLGKLEGEIQKAELAAEMSSSGALDRMAKSFEKIIGSWSNLGTDIGDTINKFWEDFETNGKSATEVLKKDIKSIFEGAASAGKQAMAELRSAVSGAKPGLAPSPGAGPAAGPSRPGFSLVDIPEVLEGSRFEKMQEAINKAKATIKDFAKAEAFLASTLAGKIEELNKATQFGDEDPNLKSKLEDIAGVIDDLRGKQEALNRAKSVEIYLTEQNAQKLKEQFALLKLEASGGVWDGLEAGLLQFAFKTKTVFEGIRDVVSSFLNELASTVSQTITDAFDPTKDVDLKERFGRFLQDIAQMAIQTFLKIAMSKAIMGLGLGGGMGLAQGGKVPGHAQASLAHFLAPQGLARGGRPSGLHPTDTVPIWAAPGEFMMKVGAVRKYGADVMAKINAGLLDPTSLRGLAGSVRAARARGRGPGFASGGEVTHDRQVPVGSASGGVSVTRSVVVADDGTFETFLYGGKGAFLRFLREHRDDVQGALA